MADNEFLISQFNEFATMIISIGDSGSPCRNPLAWLKNLVLLPLNLIVDEDDFRISTAATHFRKKPLSIYKLVK